MTIAATCMGLRSGGKLTREEHAAPVPAQDCGSDLNPGSPSERVLSCLQDQLHQASGGPGELGDIGAGFYGPSFLTALRHRVRPLRPTCPHPTGLWGACCVVTSSKGALRPCLGPATVGSLICGIQANAYPGPAVHPFLGKSVLFTKRHLQEYS